jgi:hypothetical protein
VVLGSGLLRDVPFRHLAATFQKVVLVDAVHLLPARVAAWRRGAISLVAGLSSESGSLRRLAADKTVDLVVSANLLSQMPLPHRRQSDEWEDFSLTTTIGRQHLADLFAFHAVRCLVTDVAYRDDAGDDEGEETALVDEALLPPAAATWDWTVAPRGEISRGFARVHRVGAWCWEPEAGFEEPIHP